MSRAKYFNPNGENVWFDYKARATADQLELLADYEGLELDDLLDEGLSQKQVARRLFEATTHVVPPEVLERRRERQRRQGMSPACRICSLNGWECEGRITRHHFVPRWLMLELENYQAYAMRSVCTIPICLSRHRDLHLRSDGTPKGILPYLREHERQFAQRLLDELKLEHPHIYDLLAAGDECEAYEAQLIHDHVKGCFRSDDGSYVLSDYPEKSSERIYNVHGTTTVEYLKSAVA